MLLAVTCETQYGVVWMIGWLMLSLRACTANDTAEGQS